MIRLKDILSEAFPRNLRDLRRYLEQKEKMGAINRQDASDIYHTYEYEVTSGHMGEQEAIKAALKDVAAQSSKTEAGDPLRKSYRGTAAKDYGTNKPQNRTNFRPGAPNPKLPQSKAPKPKPIKEAEGIVPEQDRLSLYKDVTSIQKSVEGLKRALGRRSRPGQTFLSLDDVMALQSEAWLIEMRGKSVSERLDKLAEAYKRGHR